MEVCDMAFQTACVVDNRDAQEMYGYLEARVETMKRRIKELEGENERLRHLLDSEFSPLMQSA
jgi:cell division protein FtsB